LSPEPASPLPRVDLVVPVYNEEAALPAFHQRLCSALSGLPYQFRILYINDGSSDRTGEILAGLAGVDAQVAAVELSRNFGHQAALTAGLDLADGDYIITLDGDGQHPPELIASMLQLAQGGYDIVLTQRADAQSGPNFKNWSSGLFYRLINRISSTRILPGSADFRLMSRSVVQALRKMREYHRFLRGMISWMGYKTVILPYQPAERLAGQSKYSFAKMLRLGLDAVFSFSLVPMYIGISLGALFLVLALVEMVYVLSFWISGTQASLQPGWSSLMFVLLVVGGTVMITLGFIGVYIGYIFQEVKRRPSYLVRSITAQQPPKSHSLEEQP
jgi:polyisoprenyl-phosphate glycosyltransferase